MLKFIHAADIHLDSPLRRLEQYDGAPLDALRGATRRAFDNMVDLAMEERVDFLLIAGDVYDGDWKDYNTGLFFASRMARLKAAGIDVFIVAGNHDAANAMTKTLEQKNGVRFFSTSAPESVRIEELGVVIHGQSFANKAQKKDMAAAYPLAEPGMFNIGLLHTCATGREGHEPYAPCTVDGLLSKGYDYWALGHVHQHEILHQDPPIVFPGNTQGRHARETGEKGCLLVIVDERGKPELDFKTLDVLRWELCTVDATGLDNGHELVDRVANELEALQEKHGAISLAVRVLVTGACEAHDELVADKERWVNEIRAMSLDLGADQVWVEKIQLQTTRAAQHAQAEGPERHVDEGPVGELLHYLETIQDDPAWREAFAASLDELWRKLPREFKQEQWSNPTQDTAWLDNAMNQVKPLLLRELLPAANKEGA